MSDSSEESPWDTVKDFKAGDILVSESPTTTIETDYYFFVVKHKTKTGKYRVLGIDSIELHRNSQKHRFWSHVAPDPKKLTCETRLINQKGIWNERAFNMKWLHEKYDPDEDYVEYSDALV